MSDWGSVGNQDSDEEISSQVGADENAYVFPWTADILEYTENLRPYVKLSAFSKAKEKEVILKMKQQFPKFEAAQCMPAIVHMYLELKVLDSGVKVEAPWALLGCPTYARKLEELAENFSSQVAKSTQVILESTTRTFKKKPKLTPSSREPIPEVVLDAQATELAWSELIAGAIRDLINIMVAAQFKKKNLFVQDEVTMVKLERALAETDCTTFAQGKSQAVVVTTVANVLIENYFENSGNTAAVDFSIHRFIGTMLNRIGMVKRRKLNPEPKEEGGPRKTSTDWGKNWRETGGGNNNWTKQPAVPTTSWNSSDRGNTSWTGGKKPEVSSWSAAPRPELALKQALRKLLFKNFDPAKVKAASKLIYCPYENASTCKFHQDCFFGHQKADCFVVPSEEALEKDQAKLIEDLKAQLR
jgi:hypothetical protein